MNYPLLLTFNGVIFGNGFLAEVTMRGRLLASVEADGTWLYGVNPGAIAEDGRNLDEAHANIRERLKTVLADIAASAGSVEMFRSQVEAFFHQTDDPTVKEWEDGVAAVRSANLTLGNLPKQPAETELFVSVTAKTLSESKPADNFVTSETALAEPKAA